jgi:uncharacterized membrane protein YsdA (DUF1294 family)
MGVLFGFVLYNTTLNFYPAWLLGLGIVTFVAYSFDKWQSKRQGWRVAEIMLHLLALAGGFVGGWAGMFWFRHKTQHRSFFIWLIIATLFHLWLLNLGVVRLE